MKFVFATFAAVFLLFTPASCAPAGMSLQGACADVRNSSLELNRIAKRVSVEARNGSKDVSDFSTSLVWIEAKDMCDPETLKHRSTICIEKISNALTSYESAIEDVAGFQSCSEFARRVKPALHKLHTDMSRCVNLKHQKGSHITKQVPIDHWQEALLCHYTLDRLFSFSVLTARVFAVGDPAHHTVASAQKCI
ncbi:hypothetical protein PAMP_012434 [Pampus punctatissimus]